MIAAAVVYIGTRAPAPLNVAPVAERPAAGPRAELKLALDADDHIYGNPEAETFIIEYSDIDCPFCARVHPTIKSVVDESNGTVAWVYRQFPIEQLHPEAPFKAAATECVAKLAGNEAFWTYLDGLIQGGPVDTYSNFGITSADFDACVTSAEIAEAVEADMERAVAKGGVGTPFSIVATRKHGIPVNGAVPKAAWLQAITAVTNN
jgi:protein-disulfide isomerase